jgi:hypothetical protein
MIPISACGKRPPKVADRKTGNYTGPKFRLWKNQENSSRQENALRALKRNWFEGFDGTAEAVP